MVHIYQRASEIFFVGCGLRLIVKWSDLYLGERAIILTYALFIYLFIYCFFVKGAGADFVMMGGMFAGHDQSGKE